MQTTKRLARAGVVCSCLAAPFLVSCVSGQRQSHDNRATFVEAVVGSVQLGNAFNYDVAEVMPIGDGTSQEARWLCYLFGGPPTSTAGAGGVFDLAGRLLDAKPLKGFYAYETNATVLAEGDSVILRILDASGTGLHTESLLVLTLSGGKLLETFRCIGLNYSMHGEFCDEKVELDFRGLYGDRAPELIRLVTTNRYASSADQQNEKPSETKYTAEVFQFDTKARRYVRAFE